MPKLFSPFILVMLLIVVLGLLAMAGQFHVSAHLLPLLSF